MKIFCLSLGCDKNRVDTERMLALLAREGYTFTDDEKEADIALINTCCFIGDAAQESVDTILAMAERKQSGNLKALIVTGCLAERYREEIFAEIPEVDAVLGTASYDEICEALREVGEGKKPALLKEPGTEPRPAGERLLSTGGFYAYLKIAEGCDKHCTYCVIPSLRGPYRSAPMEDLLAEAACLAAQGVKELILVAQETTLYGVDLYGKKMLPELLQGLAAIEGIVWIRILYCYPEEITDELITVIASEKKVCHYLDIPVQHASDAVLKRMGRKTNREELKAIISRLRERIPDIILRTTLITGFPGETEEDMDELLGFVDEMEFDRLGVFPYSAEEGTPAAAFADPVPEEEKLRRRDAVMQLQQQIVFEKAKNRIGDVLDVLIEGEIPEEGVYIGRTYMDAPEVDGCIFVEGAGPLISGDFVKVLVTAAAGYDLIGDLK